jgi:hypothetical protein
MGHSFNCSLLKRRWLYNHKRKELVWSVSNKCDKIRAQWPAYLFRFVCRLFITLACVALNINPELRTVKLSSGIYFEVNKKVVTNGLNSKTLY